MSSPDRRRRAARRKRPVRGRHGPQPAQTRRGRHRPWLVRLRARRPGERVIRGTHADAGVELLDQRVPAPAQPRIAVQNACSRRATNSSIGTPCCSTQV